MARRRAQTTVSLDDELQRLVGDTADRLHTSRSAVVREALRAYFRPRGSGAPQATQRRRVRRVTVIGGIAVGALPVGGREPAATCSSKYAAR